MAFNSSTFIASYISTDKVIRFENTEGDIVGGFNLSAFDNVTFEGRQLWLSFSSGEKLVLEFESTAEAKTASDNLRTAIDDLYPNSVVTVVAPPASSVTIPKTFATFNTDRLASALVPNTVYTVTDTLNAFNLPVAGIFNIITDKANANKIRGFNTVNNTFVTLDFAASKVTSIHDSANKVTIDGDGSLYVPTGTVTNIYGKNSTLILDTVDKLEIRDSIVTISNSVGLKVDKSSVTLDNCLNSTFYGVVGSLASYAFENVIADIRDLESGKTGTEALSLTDGETLMAFVNTKEQTVPTLSASIAKILDSAIPTIATKMYFKVPSTIGAGKILTIKDSALATLIEIDDKYANTTIEFIFNTVTGKFELRDYLISSFKQTITVGSNGQTSFVDVLPFKVDPLDVPEISINGIVYHNLVDFSISGRSITWTSSEFSLETTDVVKFSIRGRGK